MSDEKNIKESLNHVHRQFEVPPFERVWSKARHVAASDEGHTRKSWILPLGFGTVFTAALAIFALRTTLPKVPVVTSGGLSMSIDIQELNWDYETDEFLDERNAALFSYDSPLEDGVLDALTGTEPDSHEDADFTFYQS